MIPVTKNPVEEDSATNSSRPCRKQENKKTRKVWISMMKNGKSCNLPNWISKMYVLMIFIDRKEKIQPNTACLENVDRADVKINTLSTSSQPASAPTTAALFPSDPVNWNITYRAKSYYIFPHPSSAHLDSANQNDSDTVSPKKRQDKDTDIEGAPYRPREKAVRNIKLRNQIDGR